MRKLLLTLTTLIIFATRIGTPAQQTFGQVPGSTPGNPTNPQEAARLTSVRQSGERSTLPRFDLDFRGGTPQSLIDEIRKQIGVLNAIVPVEHENVQLPPLRMQNVDVSELFMALSAASGGHVIVSYGTGSDGRSIPSTFNTSYGFRTHGPATPEAVWHFFHTDPRALHDYKTYRFYQLAPYLGSLTVEDITTAIQAGWKMMGETNTPQLNYHKETKLLIAVGKPGHLSMINAVLSELPRAPTNSWGMSSFKEVRVGTNAPAIPSK